jgi:hypothetical protein
MVKISFFLDTTWVVVGVSQNIRAQNDSGDFYGAPKFDFLKILINFFLEIFFWNSIKTKPRSEISYANITDQAIFYH